MNKGRKGRAGGMATSTKPKSLMLYKGGKYRLAPKIVPIVEHAAKTYGLKSYRECCGGGTRILMNLPANLFSREELDHE